MGTGIDQESCSSIAGCEPHFITEIRETFGKSLKILVAVWSSISSTPADPTITIRFMTTLHPAFSPVHTYQKTPVTKGGRIFR